jgi:hypothetical protein
MTTYNIRTPAWPNTAVPVHLSVVAQDLALYTIIFSILKYRLLVSPRAGGAAAGAGGVVSTRQPSSGPPMHPADQLLIPARIDFIGLDF